MRIHVNGVQLFFDVEGAKFVPDGPLMRERPTLLLLHGGPGFDHSSFRPSFSRYADIAQVIYIDHRGNGRSDDGSRDDWRLAQWGDDIFEFCRALEIERPIVMGQSFGGFVAMAYATRHPEHPGKLILSSTGADMRRHRERSIAMFEAKGGKDVGALARHVLNAGFDDVEMFRQWGSQAVPFYNTRPATDPDARTRTIMKPAVTLHFQRAEFSSFDMLADLGKIRCPTLVIGGDEDPMVPIEAHADIAAAIPPQWVRFVRFADAGHGPFRDDPSAYEVFREFVLA